MKLFIAIAAYATLLTQVAAESCTVGGEVFQFCSSDSDGAWSFENGAVCITKAECDKAYGSGQTTETEAPGQVEPSPEQDTDAPEMPAQETQAPEVPDQEEVTTPPVMLPISGGKCG